MIRHDWSLEELKEIYEMPLFNLVLRASDAHRKWHEAGEVQVCYLISVKTGGCSEDCKYCAQSSRYKTSVKPQKMMELEEVLERAKWAADRGATRVCMGAAWRSVRDNAQFDRVLEMVREVAKLGVEVCCTLGMLDEDQIKRLKEAGLTAYNHNLDSSEKFYNTIITTRSYQERLDTLDQVDSAGVSVCCGGILGMGEEPIDRIELIHTLATRGKHPESVPINMLSRVAGTPLEGAKPVSAFEMLRMVALARIAMPKAMVRLSTGRERMRMEEQALFFFAGANSIFIGEKLLTVGNASIDEDEQMFALLGMTKREAYL